MSTHICKCKNDTVEKKSHHASLGTGKKKSPKDLQPRRISVSFFSKIQWTLVVKGKGFSSSENSYTDA
jgi:hypothetical protein